MSSWRRLVSVLLPILGLLDQTLAATPSTTPVPPLNILPSESWNGNDGNWSSFFITVGTPPRPLQVFISTASNQPWVVSPEGCPSTDAACMAARGFTFTSNSSSTWVENNISAGGVFALQLESNLGFTGNGNYGTDTIVMGLPNGGAPALSSQVLAAISYTAGAPYRFDGVFGNLTLGGYDESLFVPNNLTIDFSTTGSDLTVDVEAITVTSGGGKSQVLSSASSSFPAFIDSSMPYLYLPTSICQKFEEAFGLTFDPATQLYLVNDALHTQLVAKNASVIFTLTNSTSQALVNITFPYAAFDLTASSPLVDNTTRYFPLKRAKDNTQIILGRTFLQETYLIADYERSQFSIHQRNWSAAYPASSPITILPVSTPKASTTAAKKSSSPSPGTIAGIVLGVLLSIALTLGLTIFFLRRHHKEVSSSSSANPTRSLSHKKSFQSNTSSSILPLHKTNHNKSVKNSKDKEKHVSSAPSELSFFDTATNSVLLTPSNQSLISLGIGKAIGSPNLTVNPNINTTNAPNTSSNLRKQTNLIPTEPKHTFLYASLSTRRKERKKKKEKEKEIYELCGSEVVWADPDHLPDHDSDRYSLSSTASRYTFETGSSSGLIAPLTPAVFREREMRGSESIIHMGMQRESTATGNGEWRGMRPDGMETDRGRESTRYTMTTVGGVDSPADGTGTAGTWEWERYMDVLAKERKSVVAGAGAGAGTGVGTGAGVEKKVEVKVVADEELGKRGSERVVIGGGSRFI
ncbi:Aspartic peptidase domain protein [Rutstroemia sp. NJR-2017a BBW]|nr:Aspartic peptidase domain protein [Rutstroemia sp. NJR-2017a BBW]